MVDALSQASGFPTYDPKMSEGFWRHLVIRKAHKTGEIMLIFSVNGLWIPPLAGEVGKGINGTQDFFARMVQQLTEKFPHIVSVFFLENTGRADIVQ